MHEKENYIDFFKELISSMKTRGYPCENCNRYIPNVDLVNLAHIILF